MESSKNHSFEITRKEKELVLFKFRIEKDEEDITNYPLGIYLKENHFDEIIDAVEHLILEKLSNGDKSDQEDTELALDWDENRISDNQEKHKFNVYVDWEVGSREEISEARREFEYSRLEEVEIDAQVETSDSDEEIEENELIVDLDAAFNYVLPDIKSEIEGYDNSGSFHFHLSGVDYDVKWEVV